MFKDGRTNVDDEERKGRPAVVSDDLVQIAEPNIFSGEFPQISDSLYWLGYHQKSSIKWVPKMLTGA
jgi:hypothetical protein